jgi:hypothetical protein
MRAMSAVATLQKCKFLLPARECNGCILAGDPPGRGVPTLRDAAGAAGCCWIVQAFQPLDWPFAGPHLVVACSGWLRSAWHQPTWGPCESGYGNLPLMVK